MKTITAEFINSNIEEFKSYETCIVILDDKTALFSFSNIENEKTELYISNLNDAKDVAIRLDSLGIRSLN
ncbi:MAG: hypothetical protein SFY32_06690 [Bacteroidota bacterium]|nr:hypothetical protein [Bacteroidota bacterium]